MGKAGVDFAEILSLLKAGVRVRRAAWPEYAWIQIRKPNEGAFKPTSMIIAHGLSNRGDCVTWNVGHLDLLAEDWQIAD